MSPKPSDEPVETESEIEIERIEAGVDEVLAKVGDVLDEP
jgi:hypothetical protein